MRLVFAFALSVQLALGCSWHYIIWGIRTSSAEPLFRFVEGNRVGYIDAAGHVVIKPTFPYDSSNFGGEFHEGLLEFGSNYYDRSGKRAFPGDYWLGSHFEDGLAPASQKSSEKFGYINRRGSFEIPPTFDHASRFSEGLAQVEVSRRVGYIDKHGKFAIAVRFAYGTDFHEGAALAVVDGNCRVLNGGSCERPRFGGFLRSCGFSYVSTQGKVLWDRTYEDADRFSEGLAPVQIKGRWGFIDKTGEVVIKPAFEFAEPFSEGLAAVTLSGKLGFIDHSGKLVIPAVHSSPFHSDEAFSGGLALVADYKAGFSYITKTGQPAFEGRFGSATRFAHGLAHVGFDKPATGTGRFAYIDKAGKEVFSYRIEKRR